MDSAKYVTQHKCHDLGLPLFLSLSHSVVHALTHTHMHTDTYISLSPTCLSFQSAFALLCSATCSHSSNQSLYLQRLCSRLSVGLLYDMHSMCSLTYLRVEFSYLVLSRLEMLKVSVFFSVSCYRLQWVRFHEVSLDWSPLDLIVFKFCFVISQFCGYAWQTALFCSFIKDCVN